MQRKPLWLLAPVLALAVTSTALLGLNVAIAVSGSMSEPPFDEGAVIKSSFVIGRGIQPGNIPDEVTAEYWLKVGPGGQEESLKATLRDASGTLVQEGIRRRVDGIANTYVRDTSEVIQTARPNQLSSVMWTHESVNQELLKEGFELIAKTEIGEVSANTYEQRTDLVGEGPTELFEAAGVDATQIAGVVRRVHIGTQPFGVDLGEAAGYVLSDGSELIPYYRRISSWEVLDHEAPAGTFEWSPSVAGEVIR